MPTLTESKEVPLLVTGIPIDFYNRFKALCCTMHGKTVRQKIEEMIHNFLEEED